MSIEIQDVIQEVKTILNYDEKLINKADYKNIIRNLVEIIEVMDKRIDQLSNKHESMEQMINYYNNLIEQYKEEINCELIKEG